MLDKTYALILAGGSGTRFWPLSRNHKPKQLLALFDEETLIEKTVNRLDGLIPKERIFILTNSLQHQAICDTLPAIPEENIIAEPEKRDTAPAVALGVGLIAARDPEATMLVLPADQLINDTAAFHTVMQDATSVAQQSASIVTVGIKPTWASSSFGYIERGEKIAFSEVKNAVCEVSRFREKPAPALAEHFLQQGNFCWNAGMFIWSVKTVRHELQQHCPQLAAFIEELTQAKDCKQFIKTTFSTLDAISIDYALMEHAKHIYNIEASFDWDDVGSWISVAKYLTEHQGNQTNSPLTIEKASNNIVFSESGKKQIALLGVKDLIVVQTDDAILVANQSDADNIKHIVQALPNHLQ